NDFDVVMMEKGGYYDMEFMKKENEENLAKLWKNKGIFISKNFAINIAQGECIGGSTMINYGICFEIPKPVFSFWKSAFGIRITEEEMADAYQRIGKAINRRKITPDYAGLSHEIFKQGCEGLGYSCDWMDKAYVPGEGKQNALLAFLQRAKTEKVRIFANCKASKIIINGKKAVGVKGKFYDHSEKRSKTLTVNSKIVIISAGPVGSSELLLQNNIEGNNKQVGKHLSLHPSSTIIAKFDQKINGDDGLSMACYCDQFSVRKTGKPGYMIESVFVPPSQMSITMPGFGEENKKYLEDYDHYSMAGILVHDEPNGSVELNWSKDAVVNYELGKIDQMKMIDGLKEATRIFFRVGAKRVISGHMKKTVLHGLDDLRLIDNRGAGFGTILLNSAHPQGGNRMGEDPENSVVNSYCQSHEIENLYVSDASVFPTSLGVNPQMTVMALATITADKIIRG
ncbi:MAG TPA: GMC family oxidoreductase N-terminal domain-containing protein, partial [Nitrosopumilaceae archaeon]|nr:GMC family oxidoreductase N-terminal domain-containing protein [Nitrosopumilaceae archaeon]